MRVSCVVRLAMGMTVAALCGGCAAEKTQKTAGPAEPAPAMRAAGQPVTSSTPSADQPSDEIIGSEIRRLLNADPAATAGIIVEVDDGKVTLRGSAPTRATAWRAQGVANSVKGVISVANQIIVSTPRTSPVVPPAAVP